MRELKRKFSLYTFFFIIALSLACNTCLAQNQAQAAKPRITDIRFWQGPEEAQVVLDLTNPPKVSEVIQDTAGALRFTIDNCDFRPGRQRYPLKNPFLEILTIQELDNGKVSVDFKTPIGIQAKTYVLPANERKSDRIIIFLKEPAVKQQQKREAELKEVKELKSNNVKIVVIDPGHGGEDPGTSGNGIIEKNYVMVMGKLVKAYFDRDPRFKAVLTRSGDYIIPLDKRREIAERMGADAFVSLHINYNHTKSIRGIEVYYDSPKGAVTEAERLVAEKENQVDFADSKGSASSNIPLNRQDLLEKQAKTLYRSKFLAEYTINKLNASVTNLPSRGVKRAGFKVLHSLDMPSILVEFGYISNDADALILKNNINRSRLAQGVYAGVSEFLLAELPDGKDEEYLTYCKQAAAKKAAQERAEKARKKRLAQQAKLKKQQELLKSKAASKYVVKQGDTLLKIAKARGVTLNALLRANSLRTESIIKIGQVLVIPAK